MKKAHRLTFVESVVLFVPDVTAAAHWYADIFKVPVRYENPTCAFIQTSNVLLGFHPEDEKYPGGVGGTTAYWEVQDLAGAIAFLQARGAQLHRGPSLTDLGAKAAMPIDPFGCTIGLNQSTAASHEGIERTRDGRESSS